MTGSTVVDPATGVSDRPAPAARPAVLTPGTRVGRYLILDMLGSGAMGVVYSAYDPELNRQVAIKLLHMGKDPNGSAGIRFRREAQALAQLSHPNVVAVYDVGTVTDSDAGGVAEMFIAMERVEGQTLKQWLKAQRKAGQPTSIAEIVRVFVEAGRGLAAAHEAGIVHRDFKPTNVLVSRTGRVRVLDFGLAHGGSLATSGGEEPAPGTSSITDELSADPPGQSDQDGTAEPSATDRLQLLAQPVTVAGRLVGTPAYMAPEQFLGQPTDARSDQYSFCVALYEALHGQRPFPGRRVPSLRKQVLLGRVPEPDKSSRVPMWLHSVVVRGLEVKRDQRYPSMSALLLALQDDPGQRWRARARAGAAFLALVAAGAVIAFWLTTSDEPCSAAPQQVTQRWNDGLAATLTRAFIATGAPDAEDTARRVRGHFDRYIDEWQVAYVDACEATHVQRSQSPALLDLRMECLSRRLSAMDALATVLRREATPESIALAVEAGMRLPRIDECRDTDALLAAFPPPRDDPARARVERHNSELDRALALADAAHLLLAVALVEDLMPEIEAYGYPPVLARALWVYGSLQMRAGRHGESETTLYRAISAAATAGDDRLVADGLLWLVDSVSAKQQDVERARPLLRLADAAVWRAGNRDDQRSFWLVESCAHEGMLGNRQKALEQCRDSLRLARKGHGAESPAVGMILYNLSARYVELGRYRDALDTSHKAAELLTGKLGPRHRLVLMARGNAAHALRQWGRWREAVDELVSMQPLAVETLGPVHVVTLGVVLEQGLILQRQGHSMRARLLFQRAIDQSLPDTSRRGEGHLHMASLLTDVGDFEASVWHLGRAEGLGAKRDDIAQVRGQMWARQHRWAEAYAVSERALAGMEKDLRDEDFAMIPILVNMARAALAIDVTRAEAALDRARAIAVSHPHPEWPEGMAVRAATAELYFQTGRVAGALRLAEEVLSRSGGVDARDLASAHFVAAQALWAVSGHRDRAHKLAEKALAMYRELGPGWATEQTRIATWLGTHRR